MTLIGSLIALLVGLTIIVLAARQMGDIFARFNLPLISGFLFTGIIAGPFVLDFVHAEHVPQFVLLDQLSLAFIAFAAGAELELHVIRGYFRSIVSIISGQVVAVFAIGIAAIVLIKDMVPFMASLPQNEIWAIALLGATIMIARSPSSALAIIKELRARGPFTHKVLGATVLKDAVVIIIFAAAVSVAAVLVEGADFDIWLLLFVSFEILLDIGIGILIGLLLRTVSTLTNSIVKSLLILLIGLGVFWFATELHDFHLFSLPVSFFSEPLLICMTAGFYVGNYTRLGSDFQHTLEEMAPGIFLIFFTLVGVELELSVLWQAWGIVLILFAVRLIGIFIGSYAGTTLARDKSPGNALLGLGFITQAGVSVGLAKEIGVEFSEWGPQLATLSIGVIVLNQIVGPPLLKWAINRVGESHTRADSPTFDGVRDVIIFGLEDQSLALARQLANHLWNVILVTRRQEALANAADGSPRIEVMSEISATTLRNLETGRAESVVLMLSDAENLAICTLIYEEFGVKNVIVRLQDHTNFEKFHELGALVVEPGTAMVSLLDQFVRSPFAASLLLGMDSAEEFMEIEMHNPDLHGKAIRDMHFPHDVLILSISRKGTRIISHGYTRLELGDHITVVGSPNSLAELQVKFEA
ncbi:MAG: cation:proton antiporter [Caldilineaceae bacterium]|nr:cation:proton antiporter [Caldilineaceae bacterium]MCB0138987.1 cation:proton antiporter [Caldilineaceae bacterium]